MKDSKKDIVFLNQYFYPGHNTTATLPFDTARFLAAQGFSVGALVGYPREYSTDVHLPLTETAEGVEIRRIRYLQLRRLRVIGRLINYFSLTFHMWLHASYLKNYKTVVVYSNPPILPIVALRAKRKYGTKIVFVAHDVYPEVAYASKSLTPKSLISRVMNRINRELYGSADCVVALTDEMREFLLAHRPGLTPDRIVTIANWAHEKERKADPEAYERFGYPNGQFVVSYFGNMGICQDIETLMKTAEMLKDDDRVRFLIVGHGSKKESVEKRVKERGLHNVQVLNFLIGKDFEQAVAVSSCSIISLESGLKGTCAPSKYYSYLQGGQPILSIIDPDSYLAAEAKEKKIGYSVNNGDSAGLRDHILALVEHPEEVKAMGERAKKLYEEQYAYEVAMEKYRKVMEDLCR